MRNVAISACFPQSRRRARACANWTHSAFSTNSLRRRRCRKPTAHCNRSRDPVDVLEKLRLLPHDGVFRKYLRKYRENTTKIHVPSCLPPPAATPSSQHTITQLRVNRDQRNAAQSFCCLTTVVRRSRGRRVPGVLLWTRVQRPQPTTFGDERRCIHQLYGHLPLWLWLGFGVSVRG